MRIARGPASGSLVDLAEDGTEGPGARPTVVEVINPDNLGLLPALDMSALQEPAEPEDSGPPAVHSGERSE